MDLATLSSKANLLAAHPLIPSESLLRWLFENPDPTLTTYIVSLWGQELWVHRQPRGGQTLGFLLGLNDLGKDFAERLPSELADELP